MEFPPYEVEMETAREEWATPFANGKTFDDCFTDKPPANKYPYYDPASDDIRTVVGDINACLQANGEEPNEKRGSKSSLHVFVLRGYAWQRTGGRSRPGTFRPNETA